MTWNDLIPGDVVFRTPMGGYPLWVYLRPIGPRLGVYLRLDTGEMMEASRSEKQSLHGWCVLRGDEIIEGA